MAAEPAETDSAIRKVGVVGAGVMGQGIATANLKAGLTVVLADKSPEDAQRGREFVLEGFDSRGEENQKAISVAESEADLAACDLIIEAVTESLPVKRRVLARVEPHVSPQAIVASNTSSLLIGEIADGMRNPERCCGLHFCHPVRSRRLVEVVGGAETDERTVEAAITYVRSLGKLPIAVSDCPGFVVNRLLMPYFSAAQRLLRDGVPIELMESAAREFGLECGPFSLMDEYGIDVTARAGRHLAAAFPDRAGSRDVLRFLYEQGCLGRKSGAGFFRYGSDGSRMGMNPQVESCIGRPPGDRVPPDSVKLLELLLSPMIAEARLLLDERVVRGAEDVNLATIHGFGFPAATGGLLAWAERD